MGILQRTSVLPILAAALLLTGCGGGMMETSSSTAKQIPNNANGANILDATGNQFYFDTHGEMHQAGTNTLLSNFQLNWQPSQPGTYPLPGVVSVCGAHPICPGPVMQMDVVLTNNAAGTGCMAVLAIQTGFSVNPPSNNNWETESFLGLSVNPAS